MSTGSPAWLAGKAFAERQAQAAEPKPVPISVVEPAPFRQVLVRCTRCGGWVSDLVPEDFHGVHWMAVDGAPCLVDCSGAEVAP